MIELGECLVPQRLPQQAMGRTYAGRGSDLVRYGRSGQQGNWPERQPLHIKAGGRCAFACAELIRRGRTLPHVELSSGSTEAGTSPPEVPVANHHQSLRLAEAGSASTLRGPSPDPGERPPFAHVRERSPLIVPVLRIGITQPQWGIAWQRGLATVEGVVHRSREHGSIKFECLGNQP